MDFTMDFAMNRAATGGAKGVIHAQPQLMYASNEDFTPALTGFSAFCLLGATVALVLRGAARYMGRIPIGVDDVLIHIGYIALVVNIIACFLIAANNGVSLTPPTPTQMQTLQATLFTIGFSYPINVLFSRLSLLFLYRRIFGMRVRWFQIGWWSILLLLCPAWITGALVLTGLQLAKGQLNVSQGFGDASIPIISFTNAFLDLAVLILPIGMTVNLQLSNKKRWGLVGVFLLGSLGSFISFFRAGRSVEALTQNWDPRYKLFHDAMLGIAEATTIAICACLPVLRPLVRKAAQKTIRSYKDLTSKSSQKDAYINLGGRESERKDDLEMGSVHHKTSESTLDSRSNRI